MAKYLKLNPNKPNVHTFWDSTTQLGISNKQVAKVKSHALKLPAIAKALQSGHLVESTQAEYNAAKELHADQAAESQKNLKVPVTAILQGVAIPAAPPTAVPKADENEDDGQDDDTDEDDDDQDDDTDGEDDDEDEEMTKSELIDAIKESPLVKDADKKGLAKMGVDKLQSLYDTIKPKKG